MDFFTMQVRARRAEEMYFSVYAYGLLAGERVRDLKGQSAVYVRAVPKL